MANVNILDLPAQTGPIPPNAGFEIHDPVGGNKHVTVEQIRGPNEIPDGGTSGQVLIKTGPNKQDTSWGNITGLDFSNLRATPEETEDGLDNTKFATPLGVKTAIDSIPVPTSEDITYRDGTISDALDKMTFYAPDRPAAEILAADLGDGATVWIDADETMGGVRVRWNVMGGVLVDPVADDAGMIAYEQTTVFEALQEQSETIQEQTETIWQQAEIAAGIAKNTAAKDYVECPLYAPNVTFGTVNPSGGGGYPYNHDASLEWFDGRWIAMWNAGHQESVAPQYIVQSTSTDFVNWTPPVRSFTESAQSNNVVATAPIIQWQPGLIVVGGVLLCIWTHGETVYVSSKASHADKWTNVAISAPAIVLDGVTYYAPFVSADPIRLSSGRILVPVIVMSDTPNNAFFTRQKIAVSLYSDDGGVTWAWGNPAIRYDNPAGIWENIFAVQDDGTVRMFARNLTYSEVPKNMLMSAISTDGGISWSGFRFVDQVSVSSRSFVIPGTNIMLAHDAPTDGVSSTAPRRNIAIWRGDEDDYVPGFGITPNEAPTPSYPQARVRNGRVYMIYSSGFAEADRGIATAVFDAPSQGSLMPRSINDYFNGVSHLSGPARFHYSTVANKIATSTDVTTHATRFSFSAIVRPRSGAAMIDSRGVSGAAAGVVVKLDSGRVKLSLYDGSVHTDVDTGAAVPSSQDWLFVGGSFDGAAQTFDVYVVLPGGSATVTNFALPAPYSLANGGKVYMGSSVTGSSIQSVLSAHVIKYFDGVLLSQQEHRAIYNAYCANVGMTAWAGAETAAPAATANFDATRADAGANGPTWTADFDPLALTKIGYYDVETDGAVRALKMHKRQSAAISTENRNGAHPKYTFRYKMPSTRDSTVVIATIGSMSNNIVIEKTKSGNLLRIKRTIDSSTYNLGWTVADDRWYTMGVSFGDGTVTISHDLFAPQTLAFFGKQVLFLGDAYDLRSYTDNDAIWIDADGVSVKKTTSALGNSFTQSGAFSMGNWVPSLRFGDAETGITYDSSVRKGWYFKVGRLVFFSGEFLLTSKGTATGNATINGLPLNQLNEIGVANCFGVQVPFSNGMRAAMEHPMFGRVGAANEITLSRPNNATSTQAVVDADFTNTSRLRFWGAFITTL